jgi:hypothetical protein
MMCIEKPEGGESKINLYASTKQMKTNSSITSDKNAKPIVIFDKQDNWEVGQRRISSEKLTIENGLSNYNLYLLADGSTKKGKYTKGKFVIKLYGANF